jgi:pimeloyl-ACP methyl ester carboxylesterase
MIIFLSFSLPTVVKGQTKMSQKDATVLNPVSEENFVFINGIEQWVTINGNPSKPVILFLHGGPGSPLSPYAEKLYKDLEKDFVVVQWDQRGTGRTFGKTAPEELTPEYLIENPLSLELMATDGIAVTQYLLKHLGKQKIILIGTSWGSALGVKMASKHPELYYAYIGHSQIVDPLIDSDFYNKIYKMAEANKDKEAMDKLNEIGKPPYDRAKSLGQLLRIVKKYENLNSTPAPDDWFVPAPEYDNEKDNKNRSDGDDYSFINFAGDSKLGVQALSAEFDFMENNLFFQIPVYFIQGEEDLLTPKEKSKAYFNKIKAPKKKFYLLPKTAHGFNASVLETQYKIFGRIEKSIEY